MTALDDLTKVEPKRDRYGRPLIVVPGEDKPVPMTRVTTISGTLADRQGLELWKQRMVALGLAARSDLFARIAACDPTDKQTLNKLVAEAAEAAGSSVAANTGTAIHEMTERLDRGEPITIPDQWRPDIDAYTAALSGHGLIVDPAFIESFVVNLTHRYAGTADRIVRRNFSHVVADLKTGGHISLFEIAQQLALYARADGLYDPATETITPLPDSLDRSVGIVIHLPQGEGRCDLYEVDLVEGWRWAQVAMDVREGRKTKPGWKMAPPASLTDGTTRPPSDELRSQALRDRIATLRSAHPDALARLATLWPDGVPTFKSDHAHTPDELDRIETAIGHAEAVGQVPFPDEATPPSASALIERLDALPRDLLAEVEGPLKQAGVPNLRGRDVTAAHLGRVAAALVDVERAHARRAGAVLAHLESAVDDDLEMQSALVWLATSQRETPTDNYRRLTEAEAHRLEAVCAAVATGLLLVISELDGTTSVTTKPSALDHLLELYPDKTSIRDAGKQLAASLGLGSPRSAGDVSGDPLLCAVVAHDAANTPKAMTKEHT